MAFSHEKHPNPIWSFEYSLNSYYFSQTTNQIFMTRKLKIERLTAALFMLLSLEEDEFNYGSYVRQSNYTETCGTTCCVAGWYPKYFPNSRLFWFRKEYDIGLSFFGSQDADIPNVIMKYHGLSYDTILVLFYGEQFFNKEGTMIFNKDRYANLDEVIIRFETFLELLATGQIK